MGIVVLGAVFVDIKGYPSDVYIPGGRNAGRVEQMHGGVSRNIVEDIANVELQPTFIGLVDDTGAGADVVRKLKAHKVNTDYIRVTKDGMGTWLAIFDNGGDVNGMILMCNSFQKAAISALYEGSMQMPDSRMEAGVNVTRLITDFGDVGIVLSRAMPKDQILLFRRDVVHLVEQPTPGKGNFFFEELAKNGAGKKGEIFGQVGLNYGPEWLHGKITNLTTE